MLLPSSRATPLPQPSDPPEPGPDPLVDRPLLERAMSGEREALDRLFAAYQERVHELVRRRLGPGLRARVDTQDLAQSSLAEAFRDLGGFEWRGADSFDRWLHRVVENKIRQKATFFRRQKRDAAREVRPADSSELPLGVESRTPSRILGNRHELDAVERALEKLPADYAQVIRWARIDRLPYRDIGERLGGRSEDAVRKLLMRALVRLSRLVENDADGTSR